MKIFDIIADLKLEEQELELPPKLIVSDYGVVQMPKDYLYCMDCEAITPHIPSDSEYYSECRICQYTNYFDSVSCPNCNWSAENDLEGPTYEERKIHTKECNVEELHRQNVEEFEENYNKKIFTSYPDYIGCDCPTEVVYLTPHIFNEWSRSVFSMDCYNAMAWGADIRCPICGTIFDYETDNC